MCRITFMTPSSTPSAATRVWSNNRKLVSCSVMWDTRMKNLVSMLDGILGFMGWSFEVLLNCFWRMLLSWADEHSLALKAWKWPPGREGESINIWTHCRENSNGGIFYWLSQFIFYRDLKNKRYRAELKSTITITTISYSFSLLTLRKCWKAEQKRSNKWTLRNFA